MTRTNNEFEEKGRHNGNDGNDSNDGKKPNE